MTTTAGHQAITADDETIRAALREAAVPALLPALAYITGDLSLLREDLRPDTSRMMDPSGGLTPQQREDAHQLAFDALTRFRDSGGRIADPPGPEALHRMIEFVTGGGASQEYLPLFEEELAVEQDPRAPGWRKDDIAPDTAFFVVVVGAGMSGLVAAYRLQQAGVPFVVFEKNHDVGGTWLENTYPGCRVDVPNHFYSYSFAQREDWPQHFSSQDVLLDYFRDFADTHGLREHIRFGTEVVSARFDDETCTWSVQVQTPDGTETVSAQAVISAVGQLNRPHYPEIPGVDSFAGPFFHSARWEHDVDLHGKRVAVIGTGASAAQFVPVVAEQASELLVFQRTANWLIPTPNYHQECPDTMAWLFTHVPTYAHWYRLLLFWQNAEGMLQMVTVDPGYEPKDTAVSAANDMLRQLLTGYLQMQFADRPDLIEKVIPDYPPSAKRVLRDNGIWAQAIKRDNVQLICDPIAEVTESGLRMRDGTTHDVDVIIYGTGFQASDFLTPMQVWGRGGVELHEHWDGEARAYLGITTPGFPNLFLLYGPNTNIVINGSIIFFSECEVHYILGCIRMLLQDGHRALDCKPEAHDAYNARIDEGNALRAWGCSSVNSWYKNAKGHVTQNWPFSLLEYWRQTREPDPADYEML